MLSIETEARVARLFLALAEGERGVEITRQVLSDNVDFDAYQLFRFLDTENKNRVDGINIVDFLRRKNYCASQCEANLVVMFYDEDGDNSLSYCEFLNLVQSQKSIRRTTSYAKGNELSFNIEYSLTKLLQKEIELARNISSLINDLRLRCDFNVHDIFHLVKGFNGITNDSLRQFLDRNHASFLDNDIKAIMKRLDLNKDGKIDLCEFHAFLGYPNCGRCCPCKFSCGCSCCSCCCVGCCCSPRRSPRCSPRCSPRRCSPRCSPRRCSPRCSPLRSSPNRYTSEINSSIGNRPNLTSQSPERRNYTSLSPEPEVRKISPNLSLRLSPERRFSPRNSPRRASPVRSTYGYNTYNSNGFNSSMRYQDPLESEKRQFADYLRVLIECESKVERSKIDLALRSDFNVEDAFRVFELDGRGFISSQDLKYGLNLLGIYPTDSDVRLLMNRFDLTKQGTLSYADFFDMVTPFEKDYRSMVESRPPNSCCSCRCPDVFMLTTRLYLKNLFNDLIAFESRINIGRMSLASVRCNLRKLFGELDRIGLGTFSDNDLREYLKNKYIFATTKESDLLFIRLDKNRNGKVDYWEVEDELRQVY